MARAQAAAQRSPFVRRAGGQGAAGRTRDVLTTGKTGARQGQVRIGGELARYTHSVGPLDSLATAGIARLRGAGIAGEHQLRIELEPPQRERALPAGQPRGTHAELGAARPHPRRLPDARVVAVEALAIVDEVFGARPRAEHQAELRVHE